MMTSISETVCCKAICMPSQCMSETGFVVEGLVRVVSNVEAFCRTHSGEKDIDVVGKCMRSMVGVLFCSDKGGSMWSKKQMMDLCLQIQMGLKHFCSVSYIIALEGNTHGGLHALAREPGRQRNGQNDGVHSAKAKQSKKNQKKKKKSSSPRQYHVTFSIQVGVSAVVKDFQNVPLVLVLCKTAYHIT